MPTVAVPNSYTDLDSAYQECAMLYACMQACENREDYTTGAAYFGKLLNAKVEESKQTVKRRARKPGPTYVNDVMTLDTVIPNWMR